MIVSLNWNMLLLSNLFLLHICLFIVSNWGEQSQFKPTAGSSITLWQACQLVHRNPQSDFDSGIVLLMHACFNHPGGQEKICGLWTDTIVAYRIVLCDPAGERHDDEAHRGMLMSANQDTSKDPWRIMRFGWTYRGLGCMRISNNLYVVVWWKPGRNGQFGPSHQPPTNNSNPYSATHINPSPVPPFLLHTITSVICTVVSINIPF